MHVIFAIGDESTAISTFTRQLEAKANLPVCKIVDQHRGLCMLDAGYRGEPVGEAKLIQRMIDQIVVTSHVPRSTSSPKRFAKRRGSV